MSAQPDKLHELEQQLEEHREARRVYWRAIDAIYNAGDEGRRLVIEHFGEWHPPYHRRDEPESDANTAALKEGYGG